MQLTTAEVDYELESAWADLRRTLAKVNHKVKRTEELLTPRVVVARNPWSAAGAAGALGFLAGLDAKHRWDWLAAGVALGAVISALVRNSNQAGEGEQS